ncbi:MAG: hypothetical protein CME65_14090 [Halobacteriovoraceae bacterium]|nr:hypothetical protein [Halobacteriovoraceae bacterium]|tara:strand:- start:2807 stop:4456 length:1650 start_codon:yes stop_codon:yes gene_type:complete
MKVLWVIFCLAGVLDIQAMTPLEGIIYGDVSGNTEDSKFQGLLSYRYEETDQGGKELAKLLTYRAINQQGLNLGQFCEDFPQITYTNEWQKQSASRSTIGTLQFLGIDILSKAIAKFARKLEMPQNEFETLSKNIVQNYCSPNFTVYSHKTIEDNLINNFKTDAKFDLPSFSESKYFPESIKRRLGTLDATKKQFHYSILNFRALCSWNGDESDYRLLVPYLKDPMIMSYVFNNLIGQKLSVNLEEKRVDIAVDPEASKIACEDLICRKRTNEVFKRIFPRMIGSTRLQDDLYGLYCERYSRLRINTNNAHPKIKKWASEMTPYQRQLEVINFKSLMSGIPDPIMGLEEFQDIAVVMKNGVLERWNKWSNRQVKRVQASQLYEEPLEIELVSAIDSPETRRGDFAIKFNIGLSEIDEVLEDVDKIDAYFSLEFESRYLASTRERLTFFYNRGDFINSSQVKESFEKRIFEMIKDKEKYFNIKLSREDFSKLLAEELLGQLNNYRGRELKKLSREKITIPVRFSYGLFALQYIHQKFIYEQKSQEVLTFK